MKIYAWHFIRFDRRLEHDANHIIVEPGFIYSVERDCTPKICMYGMHGCKHSFDALQYAPGPVICRVRIWGNVEYDGDKLVGRNREVLWMADASAELRLFACWCVRRVWHLLTDERSRRAVEVAEAFARGKATIAKLRAARADAMDAVSSVAPSAAEAAAEAAAETVAPSAAWAATSANKWVATSSAVLAAASSAASAAAPTDEWTAAYSVSAAAWASASANEWTATRTIAGVQRAEFERRMLALEPRKSGEDLT